MRTSIFGFALLSGVDAFFFSKGTTRQWNGNTYACKCFPGDSCWPSNLEWNILNATVGGNLRVNLPPAASCYNTFQGPLGNISTYDASKCAMVTSNFGDEQFQVELPTAGLWTYFTNDTCRPTTNPSDSCTLGHYPVLYITAKTVGHIQTGIAFAKLNNLRLVIRNTGHDFLGRSVGWGSLVINTHSFKSISTTNSWTGPGGYSGPAITAGAGVQAFEALAHLNSLSPKRIMVTGECSTVGISGGLVQGGGHGPLTNFHGFLADTALQFKVITADGVLRTANPSVNPDLFWALKGGGPASYGVIVEATYKTFADLPSSGFTLDINLSTNQNETLFWEAVRAFHSYSTHFVDNGLYVYYELGPVPMTLHVQPIVGINKTIAELQAIVQPLFNDLNALGIGYLTTNQSFSTFYDLYNAMFEPEMAGNSALTGGWTLARTDVENNHPAIIQSFKTVLSAGSFIVGHMWNAGHGLSESEWNKSAVHPGFRNVVDKLITIVPVSGNAPLVEKAEAQNRLTNVVDGALRAASPNGVSYVNEADPFQPNWQTAFWGTNYPRLVSIRQRYDPTGLFYAVSTPGTEKWEQIEYGTRLCKKLN
ncbi:hypothetical protein QBC38DRAFT_489280 [Podospora fimiseda]|uniref:FAD-binding PCMH-type domain-containing protein n=1 Tax=Podospora fimiseda TaxID=252190 RepID=A0AAN7BG97_9PEZI|nr:hypothetical protein QBC38DRAFT_489280 [Podospora fimiseda]